MKSISVFRAITLALLLPALLAGPIPLFASTTVPVSVITVQITGLACTTSLGSGQFHAVAWSTGATESAAGAASFSELSISKAFDECSPALFGLVVLGTPITNLVLTEHSAGFPPTPIMAITLEKARAVSDQLVGDQSTATPTEQLTVAFGRILIQNLVNGARFCYDAALRMKC